MCEALYHKLRSKKYHDLYDDSVNTDQLAGQLRRFADTSGTECDLQTREEMLRNDQEARDNEQVPIL
jgi:hypothetical protein